MKAKVFGMAIVILCALGLSGSAGAQLELLTNPGFEYWSSGPAGPPDGWYRSHDSINARQASVWKLGGNSSCAITWISSSPQYLAQDVPISGGGCYNFSLWASDSLGLGSKIQLVIRWYDGGGSYISGSYSNTVSLDVAWHQLSSGNRRAPSDAATAHCEIRGRSPGGMVWVDEASFRDYSIALPCTTSIGQVQFNESFQGTGHDCFPSFYFECPSVMISGVVTATLPGSYSDFWLQDCEAQWSGIFVYDFSVDPQRGDQVILSVDVNEHDGLTELYNVSDYFISSSGNPLPEPLDITTADLAPSCDVNSESYEGVLVRVSDVTCTQDTNASGEWYVDDGSGECQVGDYIYHYDPYLGQTFGYINGIVHYRDGSYELLPRDASDLGPPSAIELMSFEAAAGDGRVTLTWQTASEVETHSFNIYRNDELIATVGAFGDAHDYIYVDRHVQNGVTYTYQLSDMDLSGLETIHPMVCSVTPTALPTTYALFQNYPNPFNAVTEIIYLLSEKVHTTLKVYNLLGQEVITLVDGQKEAGWHTASWNAAGNASGVYFYRLQTEYFSATKKMVFMQ